jgi:hypothetical protein
MVNEFRMLHEQHTRRSCCDPPQNPTNQQVGIGSKVLANPTITTCDKSRMLNKYRMLNEFRMLKLNAE